MPERNLVTHTLRWIATLKPAVATDSTCRPPGWHSAWAFALASMVLVYSGCSKFNQAALQDTLVPPSQSAIAKSMDEEQVPESTRNYIGQRITQDSPEARIINNSRAMEGPKVTLSASSGAQPPAPSIASATQSIDSILSAAKRTRSLPQSGNKFQGSPVAAQDDDACNHFGECDCHKKKSPVPKFADPTTAMAQALTAAKAAAADSATPTVNPEGTNSESATAIPVAPSINSPLKFATQQASGTTPAAASSSGNFLGTAAKLPAAQASKVSTYLPEPKLSPRYANADTSSTAAAKELAKALPQNGSTPSAELDLLKPLVLAPANKAATVLKALPQQPKSPVMRLQATPAALKPEAQTVRAEAQQTAQAQTPVSKTSDLTPTVDRNRLGQLGEIRVRPIDPQMALATPDNPALHVTPETSKTEPVANQHAIHASPAEVTSPTLLNPKVAAIPASSKPQTAPAEPANDADAATSFVTDVSESKRTQQTPPATQSTNMIVTPNIEIQPEPETEESHLVANAVNAGDPTLEVQNNQFSSEHQVSSMSNPGRNSFDPNNSFAANDASATPDNSPTCRCGKDACPKCSTTGPADSLNQFTIENFSPLDACRCGNRADCQCDLDLRFEPMASLPSPSSAAPQNSPSDTEASTLAAAETPEATVASKVPANEPGSDAQSDTPRDESFDESSSESFDMQPVEQPVDSPIDPAPAESPVQPRAASNANSNPGPAVFAQSDANSFEPAAGSDPATTHPNFEPSTNEFIPESAVPIQPPVAKPVSLEQQLNQTIEQVKATLTSETDQPSRNGLEVNLHLLELLKQQADQFDAPDRMINNDQKRSLQHQLDALGLMLSSGQPQSVATSTVTLDRLKQAVAELESLAELRVTNGLFCTKISGFGKYNAFSSSTFRPDQRMLIYCEIENQTAVAVRNAAGVEEIRTELVGSYAIYDRSGQVVQKATFPAINDVARNRRRDFYVYFPLQLNQLAAGDYRLELMIEDINGSKTAKLDSGLHFSVR